MAVSGADIRQPVRLFVDLLSDDRHDRARQRRLSESLQDLWLTGLIHSKRFRPEPHARRLAITLQALDGWIAGASQREIAVALAGRVRADADWTDPRGYLRDHVRRAIRRGRALMAGGYKQLLL